MQSSRTAVKNEGKFFGLLKNYYDQGDIGISETSKSGHLLDQFFRLFDNVLTLSGLFSLAAERIWFDR